MGTFMYDKWIDVRGVCVRGTGRAHRTQLPTTSKGAQIDK